MTTNDAAERLLIYLDTSDRSPKEYQRLLDAALAAERRATVERLWRAFDEIRGPLDDTEKAYIVAALREGTA